MNVINIIKSLVFLLASSLPLSLSANVIANPQFSDFTVKVSKGPFAKKIVLSEVQKNYSNNWKSEINKQLKKPVNFSGHYIIYTDYGGHGKECNFAGGTCGWIIDKLTGEVVSELPKDDNGSSVYASLGDNGTPIGLPFEIDAYKDSSMIAILGQSIPPSKSKDNSPVCKSALFNFTGDGFVKLGEALDGCELGD